MAFTLDMCLGKSTEEIRSALSQILTGGFKPTLAVVFLSISQDRKAIVEILDKEGIKVFGCTTNGEFTDENPEKYSITVLLLDIKPAYFSVFLAEYPDRNYLDVGKVIAAKAKQLFARPASLVSFYHIETDAEQILFGFEEIIGTE